MTHLEAALPHRFSPQSLMNEQLNLFIMNMLGRSIMRRRPRI